MGRRHAFRFFGAVILIVYLNHRHATRLWRRSALGVAQRRTVRARGGARPGRPPGVVVQYKSANCTIERRVCDRRVSQRLARRGVHAGTKSRENRARK